MHTGYIKRACVMTLGVAALTSIAPDGAHAEGSAELLNASGSYQQLRYNATDALGNSIIRLRVDILDPGVEQIFWRGQGTIQVLDPSGADVGTFATGALITPTAGLPGIYQVLLVDQQPPNNLDANNFDPTLCTPASCDWTVEVRDGFGAAVPGRLFARVWRLDSGGYAQERSLSTSFYVKVPGGTSGLTAVTEMRFDGLAGFRFSIVANSDGIAGSPRRSVDSGSAPISPEFSIYLNPPVDADYSSVQALSLIHI